MNILFIGDIVGKKGRKAVRLFLEESMDELMVDFVIANGENATHGKGLTKEHMLELLSAGIDVITLGNHAFSKREINTYINDYDEILRPLNFHPIFPGKGTFLYEAEDKKIRVTNLIGRAFMEYEVYNPFDALEKVINEEEKGDIHIVDFHAEATGEKQSLAWYFDGKVTAILGTHTHVPTADLRILPQGTAYQSDVGMVGPYDGILGGDRENMVQRTRTGYPCMFELEENGPTLFCATLLTIDDHTNKVVKMKPIQKIFDI